MRETKVTERFDCDSVFVETSGQTERRIKVQAQSFNRVGAPAAQ
jgi:hypothetical protein